MGRDAVSRDAVSTVGTDSARLGEAVAALLGDRQLACAESVTAGRLASTFASVERAVTFFRGGAVTYQRSVKEALLGLTARSVLSLEAAEQMASGACRLFDAQVAVATTGLAGGDPRDGVPVGTVFVGVCVDGRVASSRHHFDGDPEEVCAAAERQALLDLLDALGPSASSGSTGRPEGSSR